MSLLLSASPTAAQLAYGLRALATSMDDPYRMEEALLAKALARGALQGVVALEGEDIRGVAAYSAFPSTTRGQIGAFVTDLWVDERMRGTGLGRQLLARVRDEMAAAWGGSFIRLNYYDDNKGAAGFYDRLGFQPRSQEIWVTLEKERLAAL
ncbi:GNAT family N-acetyltransferase [Xinfangfangia sp. CPCC 101601]|uniref:GNAT family N-acetyltransferase n=1 Tax=Pseudogemmobacter lacusdianii TaxID=3069608 RepID=A0ABU0VY63_9RHOB|nr:GNAT family N-acetyltransferase [Xinfangfangia sp. CPCC 101601]MDQ2066702.1 GNAT family N-acetyltransferase [Xinfangfangia sp. CPCC 101601]